jgi:hypothetical protein
VVRFLVDEKMRAWWGHRVGREVVLPKNLGIRRKLWVDSGCPQKIESEDSLGNEFVPQVHWESGVGSGQAGYEVIFERANCTFCGVGPVYSGGYQLILDIFGIHISLQYGGAFVVHSLKFGT